MTPRGSLQTPLNGRDPGAVGPTSARDAAAEPRGSARTAWGADLGPSGPATRPPPAILERRGGFGGDYVPAGPSGRMPRDAGGGRLIPGRRGATSGGGSGARIRALRHWRLGAIPSPEAALESPALRARQPEAAVAVRDGPVGLGAVGAVALRNWKDQAPIDVAAGLSLDLDTAQLSPVARVSLGECVQLRILPVLALRGSFLWPLGSTGACVRATYELPARARFAPLTPPARLHVSLEPLTPSGLRLTPRGIDVDASIPLVGGRAHARLDGSLVAPTSLPIRRDGTDQVRIEVRRLGFKAFW